MNACIAQCGPLYQRRRTCLATLLRRCHTVVAREHGRGVVKGLNPVHTGTVHDTHLLPRRVHSTHN